MINNFEIGRTSSSERAANKDEAIPNGITCVELITAGSDQLEDFNSKVSRFNGRLSVMVHPFFSDDTSRIGTDHRYVTQEYLGRRDKYMKACLTNGLPLVIFEQERDYTKLPQRLGDLDRGIAYTFQTEDYNPKALGGQNDWEKFIEILKNAGVNVVILGGMHLSNFKSEIAPYIEPGEFTKKIIRNMSLYADKYPKAARWLNVNIVPLGCVGGAAVHFLDAGIDVTLSTVATPCIGSQYIPMRLVPNDEP